MSADEFLDSPGGEPEIMRRLQLTMDVLVTVTQELAALRKLVTELKVTVETGGLGLRPGDDTPQQIGRTNNKGHW